MAKRLNIIGIVQGVGYRASLLAEARALHLAGWVRNRLDGSVEAVIDGPSASVDKLIEWARRGPPTARVSSVSVSEIDEPAIGSRFETRPTA
jgi:acylphosphatase